MFSVDHGAVGDGLHGGQFDNASDCACLCGWIYVYDCAMGYLA